MSPANVQKQNLISLIRNYGCEIRADPITLSSGLKSHLYIDGKKVLMHPAAINYFTNLIFDLARNLRVTVVAGPTIGADPVIGALLDRAFQDCYPLRGALIRSAVKEHGLKKRIEGFIPEPEDRVLIVEDVVTTGESVREAIRLAEESGAKVVGVVCLVDRGHGGVEALEEAGYPVVSVCRLDELELPMRHLKLVSDR
jgi:orotate phosphoribosyltransferase